MRAKTLILFITFLAILGGLGFGALRLSNVHRDKQVEKRIGEAEQMLAAKDYDNAFKVASSVMQEFTAREKLPLLIYIQARSLQGLNRSAEAMERWKRIYDEYPKSTYGAEATVALADVELAKGDAAAVAEAYEKYRQIEQNFPDTDAYHQALFGFAKIDLMDNKLVSAQETLRRLLKASPDFTRRADAEKMLGDLNVRMLRDVSLTLPGEQIYTVKSGDALESIGRRFKVRYEMIMLANGIKDEKRLRLGQKLKIPNLNFSIKVDKTDNTLTLLNGNEFFKKYDVRTGVRPEQTPTGKYKIELKQKDPIWYHEGKAIPAGDPANELGTRWMAFSNRDLGLHGTIDPASIGKYSSNGCVGLRKEDIEELYDMVPTGTPVEIVGAQSPQRRVDG